MQIQLISVAQKMPAWVDAACADYLKRMPRELTPTLVTVPLAASKSQQSATRRCERECELILARLQPASLNIALDDKGRSWTSEARVNLIVGGPDGLSRQCLEACQQRVSLGRMTMPHALVRVVLLEQLYRAWTICQGHPYHRE
jgi:23S rRNA (pseudouridine1915-N3)-methyltransferase